LKNSGFKPWLTGSRSSRRKKSRCQFDLHHILHWLQQNRCITALNIF